MRSVQEREDRFEVDPDWVTPQVMRLVPNGGRLDQEVRRFENTYFDTPAAGLRAFGATAAPGRGSETGWQLKVPNGTTRTELQSGSRTTRLPAALAKGVAGLLAGETRQAVATMVTTRTAYRLLDAHGELVLQIATTRWHPARLMVSRHCISGVRWKLSWGPPGRRRT